MDYTLIASMAIYVLTIRAVANNKLTPAQASLLSVGSMFILTTIVYAILISSIASPWQALTLSRLATLVIQLLAAYFIFHKLNDVDEEYTTYIAWGGLGWAFVFLLVPFMVSQIL